MDTTKTLQAALTAAFTALTIYLNALIVPLIVLLVIMICDYITGMIKAYLTAQLSSRTGVLGIVKKLCYGIAVAVAMGVDYIISLGLSNFGVEVPNNMTVALLVTIWLILNEMLSILENLAVIGVPLPQFLKKFVTKLKVTTEKESEEK